MNIFERKDPNEYRAVYQRLWQLIRSVWLW